MSQIPPYYQNVFAQTSQNNFQPKQQQNVRPQIIPNVNSYATNQPGTSYQNQPLQPYQAECIGNQTFPSQNLITNPYQHLCSTPSGTQNQNNFGSLPQCIMDQFRSCVNSGAPIFILPNACSNPAPATPQLPNSMLGHNMGYPINYSPIGIPCPVASTFCLPPPSCIQYALPIPFYNNVNTQERKKEKSNNCDCCPKEEATKDTLKNPNTFNEIEEHKCKNSKEDDTICSKKNCPSSLNLQALASQFLSIQGIIPCVATRLILRKVPGSSVTTSVDETVNRALVSINQLKKDELLTESRNAQQVNALINLHMTANAPSNIIPILTMIQLKVNLLKAQVEHLVNKKLMENQGIGAEGAGNLDPFVLALKTDAELRDFLAALREKECQERVNLNFAPYHAQRSIAENRLTNIQNKISQVEDEMSRRRNNSVPRTSIVNHLQCQFPNACCYSNNYTFDSSRTCGSSGTTPTQTYESPDPFVIQVRSPKRLNLKPHVGSPETTYEQYKDTEDDMKIVCCRSQKQHSENENCLFKSPADPSTRNNLNDQDKHERKPNQNNQLEELKIRGCCIREISSKLSQDLSNVADNKMEECNSVESGKISSEADNIPSKEFSQKSHIMGKTDNEEKKIANDNVSKTSEKEHVEENKIRESVALMDENLENEDKSSSNIGLQTKIEEDLTEKENVTDDQERKKFDEESKKQLSSE